MSDPHLPDYYEILQLSVQADQDTIQRVFRYLAQRFHPDNLESGNTERFTRLSEAYHVLVDPEQRARYDARYEQVRESRWRVFDQETAIDDIAADRRIRAAILGVLYTARRNNADQPGIGIVDLERLLGCPEAHMKFHLWYLRENGWVQRLDDGRLTISASGVDRVLESGGPASGLPLLNPGPRNGTAAHPNGSDGDGSHTNGNGTHGSRIHSAL
jgi:curved DNA-binding protein